jgi:hypothetical protein
MTTTIEWKLRNDLRYFPGAQLPVLLSLILHANRNWRAWPNTTKICEDIAYSTAPVTQALKDLEAKRAIIRVPFSKRINEETQLPGNKSVWQLTGMYQVDGVWSNYCLFPHVPEDLQTLLYVMGEIDRGITKHICNFLESKILLSKKEDNTSLKGGKDISPDGETDAEKIKKRKHTAEVRMIFAGLKDGTLRTRPRIDGDVCELCGGSVNFEKGYICLQCGHTNALLVAEKVPSVEDVDDEMLVPTETPAQSQPLTEDELKQLATAFVEGYVPVADYNREICKGLLDKTLLKMRGQGKGRITSYELTHIGERLCQNPLDGLGEEIQRKRDVKAIVEARKAEAKKKRRKKKDKAPPDIVTMPEIQEIAEALCDIHFSTTFSLIEDSDKHTIVSLAHTYRNQGADTAKKVKQIHEHYKRHDWYKQLSIWGLTKNMRIQQALAELAKSKSAEQDKPFEIEEIEG